MFNLAGYDEIEFIDSQDGISLYRVSRIEDRFSFIAKTTEDLSRHAEMNSTFKFEYERLQELNGNGSLVPDRLINIGERPVLLLRDIGGTTLQQLIKIQRNSLHLSDLLKMAIALVDCLHQIHLQKLTIRQITPFDLFVSDNLSEVKISNYSVALVGTHHGDKAKELSTRDSALPYLSPEQTGRTGMIPDHRSDIYSIGVILYEWFLGSLPFTSQQAIDLIYKHLTVVPEPLSTHNKSIPAMVSAIVLKCMEKMPNARYSSAYGIKSDLEECMIQLRVSGKVRPFKLARRDTVMEWNASEAIIDRYSEQQALLEVVERVGNGSKEAVWISGDAGIGKTSLVLEMMRKLEDDEIIFVTGRIEQGLVIRPYEIWLQIVEQLVAHLLAGDFNQTEQWKQRVWSILQGEGQILLEQIPLLKRFTEGQLFTEQLSSSSEKRSMRQVLLNVLLMLCDIERTIIIFLDDVQIIDEASLNILSEILNHADSQRILIIAASQHVEHDWVQWKKNFEQSRTRIHYINLAPLQRSSYKRLITNKLHGSDESIEELIDFVYHKSKGNPLQLQITLRDLQERKLIAFDEGSRVWRWDIQLIIEQNDSEHANDLPGNWQHLSEHLKLILGQAAYLGEQFELQMLVDITQLQRGELLRLIQFAIEDGVIYQIHMERIIYRFHNNHVFQLAYDYVPEQERSKLHMEIGMLLEQRRAEGEDISLFEVVNRLNLGVVELIRLGKNYELAAQNIQAGQMAKQSLMIPESLVYFRMATELLKNEWSNHYELTCKAYQERATSEFLNANFDEAQQLFDLIVNYTATDYDRAQVYLMMIRLEMNRDQFHAVIQLAEKALDLLGVRYNFSPGSLSLLHQLLRMKTRLGKQSIDTIKALPIMKDERLKAAMTVFDYASHASFVVKKDGWLSSVLTMLQLTLKHGITEESATGFVGYALVQQYQFHQYEEAYKWGSLACEIAKPIPRLYAQTVAAMASCHHSWRAADPYLIPAVPDDACRSALESGDLWQANQVMMVNCALLFHYSYPLKELYVKLLMHAVHLKRNNNILHEKQAAVLTRMITDLTGYRAINDPYSTIDITGQSFLADVSGDDGQFLQESVFIYQYVTGYVFGCYEDAYQALLASRRRFKKVDSVIESSDDFCFYYALIAQERFESQTERVKIEHRNYVRKGMKHFKRLAKRAPYNSLHKYLLICAIDAALRSKLQQAEAFYEEALDAARANGHVHDYSMIAESYARYELKQSKMRQAKLYMMEAYDSYRAWGATAKLLHLEASYRSLLLLKQQTDNELNNIDYLSVVQSAQALSGEMEMDKLLRMLLRIMLQNAGAEYGALIINNEGEWIVEAHGTINELSLQPIPLENADTIVPITVISYAVRTREELVLQDVASSSIFERNEYMRRYEAKSVLCLPILYQNQLICMLYMDNRLSTGVFTEKRLDVLKLLSSQCAISIANAKLYSGIQFLKNNLEQQVEERTRALEKSMQATSEAIAEATIYAERNRIAGEIHDIVGHTLTSTIFQIEAGQRLLQRNKEDALNKFKEAQSLVRHSLKEIRNSVHMMREDHYYDIEVALRKLINETENNTGVIIHSSIDAIPDVSFIHKKVIYHALQEGLTNGIRHGHCSEFHFSLQVDLDIKRLYFSLADNGKGDTPIVMGFGLTMMQDRVHQLKGILAADCAPSQGCLLRIELPYS